MSKYCSGILLWHDGIIVVWMDAEVSDEWVEPVITLGKVNEVCPGNK